jgi:hypothetical protein
MAQIKTIDGFKDYPRTLIEKFNQDDYLAKELEKEQILLQKIQD